MDIILLFRVCFYICMRVRLCKLCIPVALWVHLRILVTGSVVPAHCHDEENFAVERSRCSSRSTEAGIQFVEFLCCVRVFVFNVCTGFVCFCICLLFVLFIVCCLGFTSEKQNRRKHGRQVWRAVSLCRRF